MQLCCPWPSMTCILVIITGILTCRDMSIIIITWTNRVLVPLLSPEKDTHEY